MIDGDGGNDYDSIGELECTMGNIMGAKAQVLTQELTLFAHKDKRGTIIIRAESV